MNFVVLDYDLPADIALSRQLGVHAHPAFAVIDADGKQVVERFFGPQQEQDLRARLDAALARPSS
ncbi:MAG: hypothetical protein EXR66_07470 [Dehalococcoidia bacterium]|nr:hypothetical protein [Dehalococcoidia bacterium]